MNILEEIAKYLATALILELAKEITYNEMPDEGIKCVCIQEPRELGYVHPQIDAETHFIEVVVREATNKQAFQLATECKKLLVGECGFIDLSDELTIYTEVQGNPIWKRADQQGRKYYYFTLKVISRILN